MKRFVVISGYCHISKKGGRIYISNHKEETAIPVRYIEGILVLGGAGLSAMSINYLLEENIPVFFLTRFGKVRGILFSEFLASKTRLRKRQFRAHQFKRVEVARKIVIEKIRGIERVFGVCLEPCRSGTLRARSVEELMGIEGTASRVMFERFGEQIKGCGLDFSGRSYYPPKDRVNAILSMVYTFAYCTAYPLCVFLGFDPYLSFLHSKRGIHASFCSDIIEPVRPWLTKQVVEPFNLGTFTKDDFISHGRGYYLSKSALVKLLNWFDTIKEDLIKRIRDSILSLSEELT
jgi:CRISPR-associated protein Cas1